MMGKDGWTGEEMFPRRGQKCSSSDNWSVPLLLGEAGPVTDLFVYAFSLRMKRHFWTLKGQEGQHWHLPKEDRHNTKQLFLTSKNC